MSLINCKECNKQISNKATTCPNCGCPVENIQNQVGIEISKNFDALICYTCKIYRIEEGNKLQLTECKEKQSTYIECDKPMILQFEMGGIKAQYNIEPRK